MIVVDTNIICYLFLDSPYSQDAETLYIKDNQWAAPLLWRSEFRNVLLLYIRKEILTLKDAQDIYTTALRVMVGNEFEPEGREVLRFAAKSGCSAYDCEFIQIAKALKLPLVTRDRQLLKAFPETAREIGAQ